MPVPIDTPIPARLSAAAFPEATPLNAFFTWNEARLRRDRRYIVARDILRLLVMLNGEIEICVAHLAGNPVILWHCRGRMAVSAAKVRSARRFIEKSGRFPAAAAARRLVGTLLASIGNRDVAAHAAVFRAFEDLAGHVDLTALARLRPRGKVVTPLSRPRKILIIKHGALGDFIQALGPMPEIRRHHADDLITLLTTPRYAELAARTGLFDDIIVDPRPGALNLSGWLALRRVLRQRHFDRVIDFQTSDRSGVYAWLLRPGPMPEWSGITWRCSHPHANNHRDRLHTMDRQAEQLLMAGIHPVSLAPWLPAVGSLPPAIAGRRFVMLIPGSSPRHLAKRWPAGHYGELAVRLHRAGYLPVAVGVAGEEDIGRAIREACPEAVDLVGRTDVAELAALAQCADLTVGNDTGATHVAAAGEKPVVVLFSQSSIPNLCAPRGRIVRVLIEQDLADLAVETVFSACLALLPQNRSTQGRSSTSHAQAERGCCSTWR